MDCDRLAKLAEVQLADRKEDDSPLDAGSRERHHDDVVEPEHGGEH
jgi:hypothetical protein